MSEKWRHSKICIVINDKSQGSKPSIYGMMSYFTANLSLNLLVKEFFKLVDIWRNYK